MRYVSNYPIGVRQSVTGKSKLNINCILNDHKFLNKMVRGPQYRDTDIYSEIIENPR